jgi:hypothetical protein
MKTFNPIRVSDLIPGDIFEIGGRRYRVMKIEDGRLTYMYMKTTYTGFSYANGYEETFGCRSRQFVNLVKQNPCSGTKKVNRQKLK